MATWSKDQVKKAFEAFKNPDAEKGTEERLETALNDSGKKQFDEKAIFEIVSSFTPTHCTWRLTEAVLQELETNC